MKWYNFIIEWEECRKWFWPVIFVLFAWGAVSSLAGWPMILPGYSLLGALILWFIIWVIATIKKGGTSCRG